MAEKTVLVVDDDPLMGELMEEILSMNHYHVLVAHDGLEAMNQTNRHHIDIILMDIRLPYFSGFWFCQAFRRKKNTCNIPVVMVSALMTEDNARKAHLVGAVGTVKKPFTSQELLSAVEQNAL